MSDLHGDHQTPHQGGIWHSLNKLLLVLIGAAICIPVAYSFMPEVKKRRDANARVEELKSQIDVQHMLLARLQREESLLKHDPEYNGLIARDLLELMKDGETIYRLDTPKAAPTKK